MSDLLSNIDKRPYRADGGDISTGRLKEIADSPYSDEEKCWLAKRVLVLLDAEPIYQCEFCHHDSAGELQWHWEDVNKDFYEQYEPDRRGRRRVLYDTPQLLNDDRLNEVRAQGVDVAIEHLINKFEGTGRIDVPVMALEWLAQELRKGAQS